MDESTQVIINMRFGPPPFMTPEQYQVVHLSLSACVGFIAFRFVGRHLRLSQIPLSLLWSLYYVVGLVFHTCSWLVGDAQSYAFLGLTLLHVFVEGLLCIKVLEGETTSVDWWAKHWGTFFCVNAFVGLALWQPLNVFFLASFLALPADILVWPAAMALAQRNSSSPATKRLAYVWACNAPIICFIFGQILWGAKAENNYVGASAIALQLQYVIMGFLWLHTFHTMKNDRVGVPSLEQDDCEGMGLLPSSRVEKASSKIGGGMKAALKFTMGAVCVEFVVAVVLPLMLGRVDLSMMLMNACQSYRPGNVQMLGNIGPNFVVSLSC